MTTKLVIRVMDAGGAMLGSVVHHAAVKGDGCLRAAGPVVVGVAQSGFPTYVSLHWADLNVEVRVSSPFGSLQAGEIVTLFPSDAPLITVGQMPGPLPPIVVGTSVAVEIPVGGIGARS